jgi:hypothetical protein
MSLGRRQVFRLAKGYPQRGPEALVSRKRGRRSNRSYPADLRDAAISIIRALSGLWPDPGSDSRLLPSLSRATPSAVSEQFSELIGCPISKSLTTCCVSVELRSLPSTGVTRLPRYCEPLRHPKAPGLSLAGIRLVIADHALGLPVLRTLSLRTCRRQHPGCSNWA